MDNQTQGQANDFEDYPDENRTMSAYESLLYFNYPYYIEGIGIFVIGLIGLGINGLAIYRLSKQKPKRIFHLLLLSLAVYDFLHVLLSVACFSLPQLSQWYRNRVLIFSIPYLIPLAQMTLSGSSYNTVTLTVERYISVCWPYFCYRYNIRPRHYIIPVLIFSLAYNLPRFFEWKTLSETYQLPCQMTSPGGEDLKFEPNATDAVFNTWPGPPSAMNLSSIPQSSIEFREDGNFTFWMQEDIDPAEANCTEEHLNVSLVARDLRKNPVYITVYINWMNFLVNLLLPVLLLGILNISIYRNMPRLNRSPTAFTNSIRNGQSGGGTGSCRFNAASPQQSTLHTRPPDGTMEPQENEDSNKNKEANVIITVNSSGGEGPSKPAHSTLKGILHHSSVRSGPQGSVQVVDPEDAAAKRHKEKERERDTRYTRASILMVVVFLSCHVPRFATNVMELLLFHGNFEHQPTWFHVLASFNHLLVTANSSFNFLIYFSSCHAKKADKNSWDQVLWKRLGYFWNYLMNCLGCKGSSDSLSAASSCGSRADLNNTDTKSSRVKRWMRKYSIEDEQDENFELKSLTTAVIETKSCSYNGEML